MFGDRKGKRDPRSDSRRFVDAVLCWRALRRVGATSRKTGLVPTRRPSVITIDIEASLFDRIFEAVAADRDLEWLLIAAAVIRANAQAASGWRKGEPRPRLSGARAGGFGS